MDKFDEPYLKEFQEANLLYEYRQAKGVDLHHQGKGKGHIRVLWEKCSYA